MQKEQLLQRMLKDDEQFREQLLKRYLGKLSGETLGPLGADGASNVHSGQIDVRIAGSVGRSRGASRMAPNLLTNMNKVQQIYQV